MKDARAPSVTCIRNVFASHEAELKAAFLSGATAEDLVKAMRLLKSMALEQGDKDALKLFLQMTIGLKHRGQSMVPPLDLPKTATLAECGAAMDVVLEGLSAGALSQEEAETYAAIIDKRATILRAQNTAGEDLGDKNRPIQVVIQERAQAAQEP